MDLDMDMGSSSCQISMLWNWTTIDACFLSKTWHITTKSMFAGTCLGTICLVVCLEFLRRVAREYDAFLVRRARLRYQFLVNLDSPEGEMHTAPPSASASTSRCKDAAAATTVRTAAAAAAATIPAGAAPPPPYRPTLPEQLVRATLHMLQFAVAYFVMLLAMYFNGYIIICIIVGAFLGALVFSWEVMGSGDGVGNDATAVTKCCG
ncbi:high-affinity Cu transporter CTR3 [Aspergillus brunneoviolaceus CBS 621.78]|uniref:Ctr copper transporter n=1 Tax=Aspergillus brunneoviolaceus CBS 621.78 TaxID=1450534 RepID=A0ACD1G416_9EURO|nr:Ctr copper transporter [Aspergillus brunneoviolaceus CBS 621.78]RAH43989.1 Ctr copper transporter [Aspergillus brunneoviolaceus CBS 621.78]